MLAIIAGGVVVVKLIAKAKEKKRKSHPFSFAEVHVGKLFKIMKLDEENSGSVFLSFNPSRNYPSGEGGEWFSAVDVPKELLKEAQVLEVAKVSKTGTKTTATVISHALF
ncbi:hypothetical protein HXX01_00985 [Candidatus Nomurabacteria bacterium]|nr:hypothetical protein [Candidatus Nomurabacteria bacterium]